MWCGSEYNSLYLLCSLQLKKQQDHSHLPGYQDSFICLPITMSSFSSLAMIGTDGKILRASLMQFSVSFISLRSAVVTGRSESPNTESSSSWTLACRTHGQSINLLVAYCTSLAQGCDDLVVHQLPWVLYFWFLKQNSLSIGASLRESQSPKRDKEREISHRTSSRCG